MKFLIVTGLSGSGKSGAVNALEDIGYYCIDNIPPQLIPKFADICMQSNGQMDKVAIVTDIRGGDMFYQLDGGLEYLRHSGPDVKILFLDASDDVLIKRYKETRRRHPLDEQCHGSLLSAITKERSVLSGIREAADYYIDTSDMSMAQLRDTVTDLFMDNPDDRMAVKVMSFGFKYGMCREADIVLDVRCLPNPYYIPELKKHTGLESCVRDYVMSFEQSKELEKSFVTLLIFFSHCTGTRARPLSLSLSAARAASTGALHLRKICTLILRKRV